METYRGCQLRSMEGEEVVDRGVTYYREVTLIMFVIQDKRYFVMDNANDRAMQDAHDAAIHRAKEKIDWLLDTKIPRYEKAKENKSKVTKKPKRKRPRPQKTKKSKKRSRK